MRVLATAILLLAGFAATAAEPTVELLQRVVPGATRFEGVSRPSPYWQAYRDGTKVGWALSTSAVIGSVGYSGKPLDVLVGVDPSGLILGAAVLEQHEPIMGSTTADFDRLVADLGAAAG